MPPKMAYAIVTSRQRGMRSNDAEVDAACRDLIGRRKGGKGEQPDEHDGGEPERDPPDWVPQTVVVACAAPSVADNPDAIFETPIVDVSAPIIRPR